MGVRAFGRSVSHPKVRFARFLGVFEMLASVTGARVGVERATLGDGDITTRVAHPPDQRH